jgi:hypothetical protein
MNQSCSSVNLEPFKCEKVYLEKHMKQLISIVHLGRFVGRSCSGVVVVCIDRGSAGACYLLR